MHKTLQILVFLKAKQKNTVNYSIFGGLIAKNAGIYTAFCNFKKTWKARNTVNSGALATFGRRNAGIYACFCPWRRQTPVNYNISALFEPIFALMNAKNACIYAFPKQSKIVT